MKRQKLFATLLFPVLGAFVPAMAQAPPAACSRSLDATWIQRFLGGDDPAIQNSMQSNLSTQKKRLCGSTTAPPLIFPPGPLPTNQPWEEVADDLSGFVNIYKLSGDSGYKDLAEFAAKWFLAWNDYLVANPNRDPSIPYWGWHVESRQGYFNMDCAAAHGFRLDPKQPTRSYWVDGWQADEAWDTAAAVRGFLKYSEIDAAGTGSVYFQRAKTILDNWSFRDHSSDDGNPDTLGLIGDGPYAAAGMRWYAKSNEPCEIRYVKNTNIVMGEQLFRVYRLTLDAKYLQAATRVLYTQLWDNITHRNFGYNSYMLYAYRPGTIFADVMAPDNESTTVTHLPDGTIVCKNPASGDSCWNHLGFEAYDLYQIQQLISDLAPGLFPVPSTQADVGTAINQTMSSYRSSNFGLMVDPATGNPVFVPGSTSPTHIIAYNCAQRFSDPNPPDPTLSSYTSECVAAVTKLTNSSGGPATGGTIFYSLVPDGIFTQGPAR